MSKRKKFGPSIQDHSISRGFGRLYDLGSDLPKTRREHRASKVIFTHHMRAKTACAVGMHSSNGRKGGGVGE